MRVRYHIEIDCANCAREVEEALNGIEDVDAVSVDYINRRMVVDVPDSSADRYEDIEREIERVSHDTEPEFRMWPMEDEDEEEEEAEGFPWGIVIGCIFLVFGLAIEYAVSLDINEYVLRAVFLIGLLITGHDVFVKGKLAQLASGAIAASVTNLYDCMVTAVREMGIPLEDVVLASTLTPARYLGVQHEVGSISLGKQADVLIVDRDTLELRAVICRGRMIRN